jgi:hypothetical protein
MSEMGARHVRKIPLEPRLEVGYASLTRDKVERPDMNGLGAGHVRVRSLEPGLERAAEHVWVRSLEP